MKNILLILYFFVCSQLIAQEHFVFSPINSSNGLSDNSVRSICQLPDGRMIFITEGLVNIYDGSSFRYMHFNDQEAYPLDSYSGWHHAYVDHESHLWLKNHFKLMLFDIRTELFVPNIDSVFSAQGIKEKVVDFFMDSSENFWYLTNTDDLLFRKSGEHSAVVFNSDISKPNGNKDLLYDITANEDQLFLFYRSGLMICYDLNTHQELYRESLPDQNPNTYTNTLMVVPYHQYIYQVRNGNNKGLLLRFNTTNHNWEKVLATDYWQNTLTIDQKGHCWISSFAGIWLIDSTLQKKQLISPLHLVDGKVFETEISTQYNDNSGGLWIGSINRGLLYYHPDRFKFRNFGRSFFNLTENENLRVTCFAEQESKVWIGTQRGLYISQNNNPPLTRCNDIPANVQCNQLVKDSHQRVWLCTKNNGLYCINNKTTTHYAFPFNVEYLLESSDGTFYVCTDNTVGIFSPVSGKFHQIKNASDDRIGNIYQLSSYYEDSLLGISENGLFFFNLTNNTFSIPDTKDNLLQHSNHQINCFLKDSRGLLWFGTQDGLNVYNPAIKISRSFFEENGLVNNNIRSIIEDDSGRIWVSASNGISCINITRDNTSYNYSFANYNHFDGVIENEFISRSALKTSDNRLLWGGLDGYNEIDLSRIDSSQQELQIPLFTRFFLSGNEIKIGEKYDGNLILRQSISVTKEIKLKYTQNFIGFEFSALNYVNPTQTCYRYQLEGVDAIWKEIRTGDGVGHISYTNLAPGTYRLNVSAVDNSLKWSNRIASMIIVIRAPFRKTPLAFLLYTILLLSALLIIVTSFIKTNKQKMTKKQKEELDQMKLTFYTNISHELRTPLTLILTPLDSIIKKNRDEPLKSQLSGIYQNAANLLKLVNQLLDFRKLEMKGETLELSYCYINEFLKTIVQSFNEIAIEKEIILSFEAKVENLFANIDKDKLQKIASNLLSNALKFTPIGGQVILFLNKGTSENTAGSTIIIQVTDTGCGIPENKLPCIFDRFYQVKQNDQPSGSGIGLHLVKQYVQMHNGSVMVDSRLHEGSIFTVEIPDQLQPSEEKPISSGKKVLKSTATILVAEDNPEFRTFLHHELSEHYQVITASNGKDGLQKVREQHPVLVITDVMMPEMSGTEMCAQIKSDVLISHIPVILLTAKSSEHSRVEGFKARADAYITKPFNMDLLLMRIQNLIEQQEHRKKLFRKEININPGKITITNIDEELIRTALEHIERNMENSSYSVEQLSKEMFMDRTSLYRKIVAIAGQTPTEFIRSVRLKRAAQLLKDGLPVAEVSEQVGFGTTSYFTKCFQDEFGIKPSHFKKA